MAIPLLPAPSPTLKYSLSLFSQSPLPLSGPSHPPALPCLVPLLHSLFWYFLWLFPCYQHHPPPLNTHYHCFHNPPYPCLAHPIPLPCPSLPPHFLFFFLSLSCFFPPYSFPTLK